MEKGCETKDALRAISGSVGVASDEKANSKKYVQKKKIYIYNKICAGRARVHKRVDKYEGLRKNDEYNHCIRDKGGNGRRN